MSLWGWRFDPSVLLKVNVAFALLVLTGLVVVGVFGWQYWVAHRAWKRSLLKTQPWPMCTVTTLPGTAHETFSIVTRIDKGKKSA